MLGLQLTLEAHSAGKTLSRLLRSVRSANTNVRFQSVARRPELQFRDQRNARETWAPGNVPAVQGIDAAHPGCQHIPMDLQRVVAHRAGLRAACDKLCSVERLIGQGCSLEVPLCCYPSMLAGSAWANVWFGRTCCFQWPPIPSQT
jgi:hypothetical protein